MNEDLWALAASRLKEKDRACVELSPSNNINDILESVERRRQECIDKQWTVPRGRNKNAVVLRDVFTKIAVWINKFIAVGDIAVQYDPGHAALPWALIRFLLKVSVQNVQQYSVIAEGIEHITLALTHYTIVERLYLRRSNESTIQLRNGLTKLYTCILKFLTKSQRFYKKANAMQSIVNVSSKFSPRLDDIKQQEETVKKYIGLVAAEDRGDLEEKSENLRGILQDLQRPIERMGQEIQALHDGLTIAERGKMLQWISPIPYMQHHSQAKRDVLAGTGAWFLKDIELLGWLSSSSSSIMWLHGIAGSGKSKLMSIFVEEQLKDARRKSTPCPIYFYCTRNPAEPERASPDTILASLVRQLACSTSDGPILEPVREIYKSREANGFAAGPLTLEESSALIIQLSQDRPLTTIVIDALDECDLSSRGDLLDALSMVLQDSRSLVKILVSSRPDVDIACHLSDCLNLEIEASKNQEDIDYYINSEVDNLIDHKKLLYGKISEEMKQFIKEVLHEQAQGMFRWVSLQLRYICALRTESLIEKRLGELPATLRDLYQETYVKQLGAHVEDERLIAEATFRLLMCLRAPLTTRDFLLALQFCGEERTPLLVETVLDLCANFVVLDTDLDVFRFAHLSVREFLEKREEFDAASNHAIVAECCLQYLFYARPRYEVRTKDGWVAKDEGPNHLYRVIFQNLCHEYATLYWLLHLKESSTHRHESPLKDLFWNFMLDDQNNMTRQFMYWADLQHAFQPRVLRLYSWDLQVTRLSFDFDIPPASCCVYQPFHGVCFVASAWNFCDVLQYCISMDPHVVHLRSGSQNTPLHLACEYGNVDGAKLLVDNGAEIEVANRRGRTPMMRAIYEGHIMIVRLLLEKGANAGAKVDAMYRGSLLLAAERDFIDIVKVLLDAGADPGWEGEYPKTAPDMAIFNGNLAMVKMILQSSGQTNEIKNIPWIKASKLIRAVVDGDEAGVRGILREWPTTKISAQYLNMALWRAARHNQKNAMRLLLAKGADMNSSFDCIPVLFAAAMSQNSLRLDGTKLPLVQFLLRQGADPHVTECHGTLLHRTITFKELNMARILLEEGADINRGFAGLPLLLNAIFTDSLDIVVFLLQGGADVECVGKRNLNSPEQSHSVLYWARKRARWSVVQLLLQYGAKDGPGSCPHPHEPGSCPYGHGPGVCPHEFRRVEEAPDELEPLGVDKTPSDDAMNVEKEVSRKTIQWIST